MTRIKRIAIMLTGLLAGFGLTTAILTAKRLIDAGPPYTVNVFDKLGQPQTVDSTQFCAGLVVPPPTWAQLLPLLAAAVNAGKQAMPVTATAVTLLPLATGVAGQSLVLYGNPSFTVDTATVLTLVSGDAPNCPQNANYRQLSTPIAAYPNTPASIPASSPLTGLSVCLQSSVPAKIGGILTILR